MAENNTSKAKEIAQDLGETALEVGATEFLENLPELGTAFAGIIGNEAISTAIQTLTGGLLGAIAPSVFGIKLSYQQKRFERNILKLVNTAIEKQTIIEQRLNQLESSVRESFIDGVYRDVLLDNIISENQESMVQYNINGYINMMGLENPNDDVVITFFNTLSQMNQLDIRVLRLYLPTYESESKQETYVDVINDEHIEISQYNFIREKLYRLGMLESKNEEYRDGNLDTLCKTVTELIKQLYAKNPREVNAPKLKRISKTESYHITQLGRQYLSFIDEP
ncbi:hypothetical protein [Huintestinicola sp.]